MVPERLGGRLAKPLAGLWVKACEKAGLIAVNDEKLVDAFMQHGVDVKEDVDCGDYLAKQDDSRRWGFAEELSKATSKAGRAKGVHPHHFLVRKAPGDRERYIEYVQAMKGRRQLFWSNGLKAWWALMTSATKSSPTKAKKLRKYWGG